MIHMFAMLGKCLGEVQSFEGDVLGKQDSGVNAGSVVHVRGSFAKNL